jgi:fermentation-respiration switch protein FrsA (DUF1100 family)
MRVRKLLSLILLLVIGIVLIAAYLRYIEQRTLFYPMKEIEFLPSQMGLKYEDIFFKTSDKIDINGWFVASPNARYTVIFCHGNAGNISHRLEKIKFFHSIGCNTFIIDYRGFGRSKGKPFEGGLYLDAGGAYDYLLSRNINPEQLIGYGESIGGAVIIDLASKKRIKALIVDSTMTCAKDMVRIVFPFLPAWIFTSRFDSVNKIKSVTVPKLVIHSVNDEIVPFKLGKKLFQEAPLPKEFLEIHGGHNSSFFESEGILREKIASFLNRL